jgi:hypothetical protein
MHPRSRRGVMLTALLAPGLVLATPGAAAAHSATVRATGPIEVSAACTGQNSEVEDATWQGTDVYQEWIGCGGIGYAYSTDGGLTYSPAVELAGSDGGWDPSITVGPTGVVYAAFMVTRDTDNYPVLEASFDHGKTFTQTTSLKPSGTGTWGDRDFVAAGPHNTVYLTWDYGPKASLVKYLCPPAGSCSFSAGDLNAVIQVSSDGGKTFGPITPMGPDFPRNGGDSAPLLVDPTGRIDTLYEGGAVDPGTYKLHPGYENFTSSPDGETWPAKPLKLHPEVGSIALTSWWINGDIAIDAGGTLYATWDTQTSAGDIGYISFSRDGGRVWSTPTRVTPDTDSAPHIVQVAGGPAGTAYVGWQTSAPSQGYATYVQRFTTASGLVGTPVQVSTAYGNNAVWPGDTFGISVLSPGRLALSWGSADGTSKVSEVYADTVPVP